MIKKLSQIPQSSENEWVAFPGGELEGKRPRVACPACRARQRAGVARTRGKTVNGAAVNRPLCFGCYRAALERERSLEAAGQLDTASDARFQWTLPFDPVNVRRLEALKAVRTTERAARQAGVDAFADRRHRAQIEARHLLRMLEAGLRNEESLIARERLRAAGVHAVELQLPESWLPFVVSR